MSDPFSTFEAWTTTCGGGNPNLGNESSHSRQLGFDIVLDNFDFHVTWNETDFQNRIVGKNAQDLLDEEFEKFRQATGYAGSGEPTLEQLTAWVNDPRSNSEIIRSRDDVSTILQICCRGSINAEFVKVTAYDIQGNYTFGFDNIGDFRIGLQATYVAEYLTQSTRSHQCVMWPRLQLSHRRGAGTAALEGESARELDQWQPFSGLNGPLYRRSAI